MALAASGGMRSLGRSEELELPIHLTARWPRRLLGVAGGLTLVLHGLGHAVLPFRGMGALERGDVAQSAAALLSAIPLITFVAAGLGLMGAHLLSRVWLPALLTAAPLSLLAVGLRFDADLWPGLLLSALALAFALVAARRALRAGGTPVHVPIGRWRRLRSQLGDVVSVAMVVYVAAAALGRPLHRRWGTTEVELAQSLPGDWPGRHQAFEVNHAVTIDAPPEAVWPWLVQLGQDRGGFYSYAWLENLFGLRIRNAERVLPEHQQLRPGDLVRAAPPDWLGGRLGPALGWRVRAVEPQRALVLKGWGAFVLRPLPEGKTRFYIRSKMADRRAPVWGSALSLVSFELPHFVMERKMMLTIRDLAQKLRGSGAPSPVGTACQWPGACDGSGS